MPSHWNGNFPYNWSIVVVWLTGSCIYCFISVIRAWLKKGSLLSNGPPWIVCQPLPGSHCCPLCHSTAFSLLLLSLAPSSCKKLWLHFNGQLSHYCSPSFCKSLIELFPFKYCPHAFMIHICCDGGGGRHWQDCLLWLCRSSKGLSQLQREFCVLSKRRKQERDSKPELWSLLTESISPASPRLFLPRSPHIKPIEISHRADDGSALKNRTGGILAKSVELSGRIWPRPAGSLWEKQPILVQTTPPVESTDLGSPRLFPTSEFPFVARIRAVRGVSSMPQLTLLMRQERSPKLRELKLCLQSGCYAAGSVKNKKESGTAFEGGEKQKKCAIKSHLLIEF